MKAVAAVVGAVLCGLFILGGAGYWYLSHRAKPVVQQVEIPDITVTFPEGWRTEEMALRLKKSGVVPTAGAYLAAVQDHAAAAVLPAAIRLPAGTPLTGFLFPDTYRFQPATPPAAVVAKQLATFVSRTKDLALTYDDVVLASIVEREAKFDADRAGIAGVYANRLARGMALEADPTVQTAKLAALQPQCETADGIDVAACADIDWWPTVLRGDLQGYKADANTYVHAGLPPQPICNPGLASLEAAANPAKHAYYYFMTDADGHAHFAATLAEHNANVARYRSPAT